MKNDLNAALSIFVEEYVREKKTEYSGNALAAFIRNEIPDIISNIIKNDDRYLVQGSVGQGNWAKVPWIGIFDKFITETAQKGFYVVYLVREDYSGIYHFDQILSAHQLGLENEICISKSIKPAVFLYVSGGVNFSTWKTEEKIILAVTAFYVDNNEFEYRTDPNNPDRSWNLIDNTYK